ncbi:MULTISPECIES: TetR family transcriptional regulator [unclassified Mycobacterium]|uniref:TetR family transcriptional regulator n=1 Tax=unclassified Mycobacterium TaxID=2642494 RepID=UPI00274075C3|nr:MULTISPECIES: TetR family transcriptional regulator [unclassified Mycobacterium]MDP7703347.1 TetR family transcriptional regulator [Mycobacterium sp. TY815]MDP7721755.1 TetR family transcriptional regulator [Mycobacterium sp. TY814]
MTVVDLRAETRAYGRSRLRELALDAARDVVLDRGWSAVRMGAIATAIGVSRASVHAEFGTKDDLGQALVLREVRIFFEEMSNRLAQRPGDLPGAIGDAVSYMLDETRDNPLLQTILTRAPVDGDTSLLPLVTTRGEPLIADAVAILSTWLTDQWPELPASDVDLMAESVVRTGLSHILTQTEPKDDVARNLALLACRCLKFPDPDSGRTPR